MKRTVLAAFCIIALCSLGLAIKTGTVGAYKEGYEVTAYIAQTIPTIDGVWTTPEEWTDAEERQLDGSLNAIFRCKWEDGRTSVPSYVNHYILIEFFNDTTNDVGDYWQICYDSAEQFLFPPIGGTTPNTNCDRFDMEGHSVYLGTYVHEGDGTAWVENTNYTGGIDFEWYDTINPSPLDSNPHWIVEIRIECEHFSIQPQTWIRIAAYDESNAGAGVQAWPAGSVDVPDDWGFVLWSDAFIPEGLTFGVMVLLSSFSVLIASRYFRKRLRTESCRRGKT